MMQKRNLLLGLGLVVAITGLACASDAMDDMAAAAGDGMAPMFQVDPFWPKPLPNHWILGATIVGHHAGDLIMPWVLAIDRSLKIGAMANLIAPYPTLSEVSKRVAASYYTDTLFGSRTRGLVRALRWLG